MKILRDLPLCSKLKVTLFLTNNFAVNNSLNNPDRCIITDGVHNNGGWEIALSYEKVIEMIAKTE